MQQDEWDSDFQPPAAVPRPRATVARKRSKRSASTPRSSSSRKRRRRQQEATAERPREPNRNGGRSSRPALPETTANWVAGTKAATVATSPALSAAATLPDCDKAATAAASPTRFAAATLADNYAAPNEAALSPLLPTAGDEVGELASLVTLSSSCHGGDAGGGGVGAVLMLTPGPADRTDEQHIALLGSISPATPSQRPADRPLFQHRSSRSSSVALHGRQRLCAARQQLSQSSGPSATPPLRRQPSSSQLTGLDDDDVVSVKREKRFQSIDSDSSDLPVDGAVVPVPGNLSAVVVVRDDGLDAQVRTGADVVSLRDFAPPCSVHHEDDTADEAVGNPTLPSAVTSDPDYCPRCGVFIAAHWLAPHVCRVVTSCTPVTSRTERRLRFSPADRDVSSPGSQHGHVILFDQKDRPGTNRDSRVTDDVIDSDGDQTKDPEADRGRAVFDGYNDDDHDHDVIGGDSGVEEANDDDDLDDGVPFNALPPLIDGYSANPVDCVDDDGDGDGDGNSAQSDAAPAPAARTPELSRDLEARESDGCRLCGEYIGTGISARVNHLVVCRMSASQQSPPPSMDSEAPPLPSPWPAEAVLRLDKSDGEARLPGSAARVYEFADDPIEEDHEGTGAASAATSAWSLGPRSRARPPVPRTIADESSLPDVIVIESQDDSMDDQPEGPLCAQHRTPRSSLPALLRNQFVRSASSRRPATTPEMLLARSEEREAARQRQRGRSTRGGRGRTRPWRPRGRGRRRRATSGRQARPAA